MGSPSKMKMSRRALLESLAVAAVLPLADASRAGVESVGPSLRPFRVNIPQSVISRIFSRVRETRFPDRIETNDWRYGANWDYMKSLAAYWTTRFDWRRRRI